MGSFGKGTTGSWYIRGIQKIQKTGLGQYQTDFTGYKKPIRFKIVRPKKTYKKRKTYQKMGERVDILTLGIEEAWNMYKGVQEEDPNYAKIRFGISIPFDINDYLKGRMVIKGKIGKVIIRGIQQDLVDFETELELREKLIKAYLEEVMIGKEIKEPRSLEQVEEQWKKRQQQREQI